VLPTNSCEEPFEKGKEINLCIHPKKIALKRENKVADGNLNRIRGRIVSRTNNSNAFKVTVDIGGMVLHAANLFCPGCTSPIMRQKVQGPDYPEKML